MAILESLKSDLVSNMETEQVFQKHVVDGTSYFFSVLQNNVNDEYDLRLDIAKCCQASINDVIIIGSAKLGFSVKDDAFSAFDSLYSRSKNARDKSDIDLAVVNARFFESVTENLFDLSRHFDKNWIQTYWRTNQYYVGERVLFHEYAQYLARGWLRPDFLPNMYLANAPWIPHCTDWGKRLGRKVNVGIYSSWSFLKHYHMDHLQILRAKMKTLEAPA